MHSGRGRGRGQGRGGVADSSMPYSASYSVPYSTPYSMPYAMPYSAPLPPPFPPPPAPVFNSIPPVFTRTPFGPIPAPASYSTTPHPVRGYSTSTQRPSAAFGEALRFITEAKLDELEKQRLAYEAHSAVLQKANAIADDLPAKVEALLDGVNSWSGSGSASDTIGGELSLADIRTWLPQAKKDPNFSTQVLQGWAHTLETHIRHTLVKFEFAKLFGKLFTEWVASGDSATAIQPPTASEGGSPVETEYVDVGRKEMHEQLTRLRSLIFEPVDVDVAKFHCYLTSLFADEAPLQVLQDLRVGIRDFASWIKYTSITANDMSWTIQSLLATDLMLPDKCETLREIAENPTVLEELANILNLRLGTLETWSWPKAGIAVDMRRHLNGKYRAYTDPDILDALFLQYIGVLWQVKLKQDFRDVFASKAWKSSATPPTKSEQERRQFFLKETSSEQGIEGLRQELRKNHFLAGQLMDRVESARPYSDDSGVDTSRPRDSTEEASAIETKHKLLHMMTTDCYLNTSLYGQHTIVRTDFEWFGPSLSHDVILAVLEFLGVPHEWLNFFKTFLRMPLIFNDTPGDARIRERGTPISYALSAVCGEALLFMMDFAINQRAEGLFLYRMHDDIWLWDADSNRCAAAWKEMERFTSLAGLAFNASKTGSACVGAAIDPQLPQGDIRWGFLKFDEKKSRFLIDQDDVNTHIIELRRQISSAKSILGCVNAYNRYMAFFVRNFGGRPSCFGQAHVDDIVDTLARIQRELFSKETAGGIVGHLRSMILSRYSVGDLPQGYFYLPIDNGGLGLRNPMIEFLSVRNMVKREPELAFKKRTKNDQVTYNALKLNWETQPSTLVVYPTTTVNFMSFDEYTAHRITRLAAWRAKYHGLLRVHAFINAQNTPAMDAAIQQIKYPPSNSHDTWVFSAYGKEIMEKFGSMEAVSPTLIPIGLVQLFKTSRTKWEQ